MDVTCMQEAHFSSLPSQSNVYGLALLTMPKCVNKLLIASLKRRVFCVEYSRNNSNHLVPATREVQFTYIPSSAEIVSIDAFSKSNSARDSFVGITLVKCSDNTSTHYLNIYSDILRPGTECDLENIAQGCLTIQLGFVPYLLNHWELQGSGSNANETVWLLSGSDCQIHLFREDPMMQCFREESTSDLFPEFDEIPSIVCCFEMKQFEIGKRVTVLGCENGFVKLAAVSTHPDTKVTNMWDIELDSPIASVKLFLDSDANPQEPKFVEPKLTQAEKSDSEPELHLLVVSSLEKAVVFRNVLHRGLRKPLVLPASDGYDCLTAACVADVDMDGQNEIVLGSYGQQLLIYKWNAQSEVYFLLWVRSFSHPLLALSCVDFIGDGVNEMLVLSTKGLHILQYDPDTVANLCVERMKKLLNKSVV